MFCESRLKLCYLLVLLKSIFAISTEVRSTFNLWSTLLAETRKMSRERANLAEVMASEMLARLEIMAKDVHVLAKKVCVCSEYVWQVCVCMCVCV